jgi:hypothetical protein
LQNTIRLWEGAFANYDDELLQRVLSSDWEIVESGDSEGGSDKVGDSVKEMLLATRLQISDTEVRDIVDVTPPIRQIADHFSGDTVAKGITAYDALHLRFDGPAYLAEATIEDYGKQGELIIYDLVAEGRLASGQGEKGSVGQFIEDFTAKPETPNMFSAGLETRVVRKTTSEVKVDVLECEWARYFQERHPGVGYLMACSTDEAAYKSFNGKLRMQRSQTIMEGSSKCDFWVYSVE